MAVVAIVAALPAYADDLCHGSAFYPDQNPIDEFDLTAHQSKTPRATNARLSISARPPGIVYTERGTVLALKSKAGESDIEINFDVLGAGLRPTGLEVTVYYPTEIAALPRVTISGAFGTLAEFASRPDPKLNDVYADFKLTQAQLTAIRPSSALGFAVNEASSGSLLESGTFDIPTVPTLQTMAKAAADDLNQKCAPDDGPL